MSEQTEQREAAQHLAEQLRLLASLVEGIEGG